MMPTNFRPLHTLGSSAALALLSMVHPTEASAPPGRYSIVNGTVADSKTGLTWQQNISQLKYPMTTSSGETTATEYCSSLSLAGTQAWRVPTVKELMTIVDVTQNSPAIDPNAFPSTPADFFYSMTPSALLPGVIWTVQFDTGLADGTTAASYFKEYVRCVR